MGKSHLDDLVVLEHSKISSTINLIPARSALRKYSKKKGGLSINTEDKTWSYGSNGPRSVWVPGRFTKKVGEGGTPIYGEGVVGVYNRKQISHLNAMIYACKEIAGESGRRAIRS